MKALNPLPGQHLQCFVQNKGLQHGATSRCSSFFACKQKLDLYWEITVCMLRPQTLNQTLSGQRHHVRQLLLQVLVRTLAVGCGAVDETNRLGAKVCSDKVEATRLLLCTKP